MPYIRAVAFVAVMAASFVFLVPLQTLARKRGWALQHRVQTGFCGAVCAAIGIRVEPHGALPGESRRIIVANHVSWTDIIALASVHPLVFLAKSEVANWPALGFLARLQGTIFIERESRKDVARVNDALAATLDEGADIVIFAEGTSSDGRCVLPFRSAHFAPLAALDPAPTLAPIAVRYTNRAGEYIDVGWYGDMTFLPHLWSLMQRNGDTLCRIACGEAITTEGKDRKSLAVEAEERVRGLLGIIPSLCGARVSR